MPPKFTQVTNYGRFITKTMYLVPLIIKFVKIACLWIIDRDISKPCHSDFKGVVSRDVRSVILGEF